jgi:hypothetical protein
MMKKQIFLGILIILISAAFIMANQTSGYEINYFIKTYSYKSNLKDVSLLNIDASYYLVANLIDENKFINVKISQEGRILSANKFSYNEGLIINSAIKDNKGNIVYLGNTKTGKIAIITNSWKKLISYEKEIIGESIAASPTGYLILGKIKTSESAIIIFIDTNGNILWSKFIETGNNVLPVKAIYSYDDSFILLLNLKEKGILVVKIADTGNIIWSKLLNDSAIQASSIINARDGYIIIGNTNNEGIIISLSANGNVISSYSISSGIKLTDIIISIDMGYIISGIFNNYLNDYALIIYLDNEFNIIKSFYLNIINTSFNKIITSQFSYVFLGDYKSVKNNLLLVKINRDFSIFASYLKQINLKISKINLNTLVFEINSSIANLNNLDFSVTEEQLTLNEITIQTTNVDPAATTVTARISPVTTVTYTITPVLNYTTTQTVTNTVTQTFQLTETNTKLERIFETEVVPITTTEIIQDMPLGIALLVILFIISLGIALALFKPARY